MCEKFVQILVWELGWVGMVMTLKDTAGIWTQKFLVII